MKCVRFNDGTIKRLDDKKAQHLVITLKASYCPKWEWKQNVRDAQAKR